MPSPPARPNAGTVRGLTDSRLPIPDSALTAPAPACHRAGMDRTELITELQSLLTRVDELGDRVRRLSEENRSLRQQQEQLVGERSALLAKNEQARTRVEAMIARLKSLEQHT